MIEFLPPRDDAFGPADADDVVGFDGDDGFDDEPPRSRWLTLLAGLAVVGLLAGGVVAAAPWAGDEAATAPSTTEPAPTTTVDRRPASITVPTEPTLPSDVPTEPAGWIPVDGSRWAPNYVFSFGDQTDRFFANGFRSGAVLYTSRDEVGRTSGRWIAVVPTQPGMDSALLRVGGVETTAGDRRVVVSSAPDGVVRVEVAPWTTVATSARGPAVTITAFGIDLAAMLSVAATVALDWRAGGVRGADVSASLAPGGPLDGLQPVPVDDLAISPWAEHLGTPLSWTDVVDTRDGQWSGVRLYRPDPVGAVVQRLLLVRPVPADELTLDVERRVDELARRGLRVELGRLESNGFAIADVPLADGTRLAVTGPHDLVDLLDLVADLRPATDAEWVELVTLSMNGGLQPDLSSLMQDVRQTAIGGGGQWSADVTGGWLSIGGPDGGTWEAFTHGQGPQLVEYRTFGVAYLRATTTFPNEARRVTVQIGDDEPRTYPLREIPGTGVLAAVVELDAALPYTVRWSDADELQVEGPIDAAASASASSP